MGDRCSYTAPVVVAAIALLPCLYVGGYLAVLLPDPLSGATYRYKSRICETFFRPAHWFDRRIRPSYWLQHDMYIPTGGMHMNPEEWYSQTYELR